jgi:uncharacterized membrane protein HdeD (DUF308 family)
MLTKKPSLRKLLGAFAIVAGLYLLRPPQENQEPAENGVPKVDSVAKSQPKWRRWLEFAWLLAIPIAMFAAVTWAYDPDPDKTEKTLGYLWLAVGAAPCIVSFYLLAREERVKRGQWWEGYGATSGAFSLIFSGILLSEPEKCEAWAAVCLSCAVLAVAVIWGHCRRHEGPGD